jgi:hypothetical protein
MCDTYTTTNILARADPRYILLPSSDAPLTQASLDTHYGSAAVRAYLAPVLASSSGSGKARTARIADIEAEYRFYADRYKCALDKYLAVGAGTPTAADWLIAARTLNARVYNLLLILGKVDADLRAAAQGQAFGAICGTGGTAANGVKSQGDVLGQLSQGDSTQIRKMIEYTREKAESSQSLLNLYAFLNIVTIGVLFYVYRAT